MGSQLVVDEKNNLLRIRPQKEKQPGLVRIAAKIISYIFHPLFIPVYLSWLVIKTQSYLFAAFSDWDKTRLILMFAIMYVMFPLVSVLLMKGVGFVSSIYLRTQKDRIIPYVVCMIYYWWMWYVLHNQPEYPSEFVILSLAIFLASIGGLIANISIKISMHAISGGLMAAFVMLLGFSQDMTFGIFISIAILLAGVICTARFVDSDHTAKEIYLGLLVGILSLLLAIKFA
jgi:hypothetical protein